MMASDRRPEVSALSPLMTAAAALSLSLHQTLDMARFRFRDEGEAPPDSPEALFRDLRPRDRQVRDLYLRQGDVLRAYHGLDSAPANVALELPTGAGKTLVGLLIAEWRRVALGHRVAYLCPTVQLARQAAAKADGYGIDVVTLVRRQADWPQTDFSRFLRARAVAVSTYHAVFNSNPRLDSAQTLVLDDAHAGEGPVADLWSIRATRDTELYRSVLALVLDALPESTAERLRDEDLEGSRRRIVELVSPLAVYDEAARLSEAVTAHATDHNAYALDVIGDALHRCLLYLSWHELLLRPLIAPTASHAPFADAEQRIYMSATLGSAGELERAFGVDDITRPRMPTREDERGFGRRLFLMPSASLPERDADNVVHEAIIRAGRAVLLTQSQAQLNELVEAVVPEQTKLVPAEEIERDPETFTQAARAALLLANRYDGIDLPDQACRLIVMSGLPRGAHLQERFLGERLGAGRVLAERVRTRLTQGAGRCTRNPQDFAAVLLRGSDLLDFFSRHEELRALRPELQAEVEFGLDNSEQDDPDFLGLLDAMLDRTAEWRRADDYVRRETAGRERQLPGDADALARAAVIEVQCWRALWRGDEERAIALAQQTIDALSGGEETRPYRALWLYLGASWARWLGEAGDEESLALAERLQAEAEAVAVRLPWLPRHPRRPVETPGAGADERARRAAAELAELGVRGVRFERRLASLRTRITSDESEPFERGLRGLGRLLGFEAVRPQGEAAPDGAWRSDEVLIVWEAKTAERPDTPLSPEAVRQAATHAQWVERELGWPRPERVLTLIVSPKTAVEPAAATVAADQRLVETRLVRQIADEAVEAYRQVRQRARGLDDLGRQRTFTQAFAQRRLGSAELLARLGHRRVADG
jgi:Helicase C-terminal domain